MRVLVVLAHPPLLEGSAAGRHGVALIRGLRAHGLEVTALAADLGGESATSPPADLGAEVMPVHLEPGWGTRAYRYADPLSSFGRGPFAARVREMAQAADVVHLEEAMSAAAGRRLPVPTVCHLHCLARRDRTASAPWSADFRVFLELARAESRIQRRSRWLIASSDEVAGDLRRQGARDVTVVPLGLDPSHYAPAADAAPPVAGLIGTANWPPTRDAVVHLLGDVWPRVLARRPGAVLRLAGRGMLPTSFAGLPSPAGVEWVGPVDSAEDFLRSLGLLLYPLGRGSGTKVKVLEAMAIGLPVITTPPGAEGLARGEGVRVETGAGPLADAAVELLGDAALRRGRGVAGRAQFARDHAPGPATAALPALYERMVASAPLRTRPGRPGVYPPADVPGLRERLVGAADAAGVGSSLRSARGRAADILRSQEDRAAEARNQTDDDNLRLLIAFLLREDSNCVEVGTHEGVFLHEYLRVAPRGRHIAYEPLPHLHEALTSSFPTVDVRRAALSNEEGETSFVHVPELSGYSGLRERSYPQEVATEKMVVRMERLDDHLPEGYVPDFIKIDVEGAECLVLEGALETIKTHRPTVMVEHGRGGADHYGKGPDDLYYLLCKEARLRIFDLDGNGPYTQAQLRESFATGRVWNYVAHP